LLETARESALERCTLAAWRRPGAARGSALGDRAFLSALLRVRQNCNAVVIGTKFLERWAVFAHVAETTAVVADDVRGFCVVSIETVLERESVKASIVLGRFVTDDEREVGRRECLKIGRSSEATSNREACFLQGTERTSRRDVAADKTRCVNPC
jgi:hypothetical protein